MIATMGGNMGMVCCVGIQIRKNTMGRVTIVNLQWLDLQKFAVYTNWSTILHKKKTYTCVY